MFRSVKVLIIVMLFSAGFLFSREITSLSGEWQFAKVNEDYSIGMDVDFEQVMVPHTWNTDLINGDSYYLGKGLYHKELSLSAVDQKRFFIRFEGASTIAKLYVNGQFAGIHEGAYSAFCFEVSSLIQKGLNQIEVVVDNGYNNDITPVANALFTRFGGIYRPLVLITTGEIAISPLDFASPGVYISPVSVTREQAHVSIKTLLSGEGVDRSSIRLKTEIINAEGEVVSDQITTAPSDRVIQDFNISNPHLWNGKADPYRYEVKVSLLSADFILDEIVQPLGLRYFHVDAKKGFFLNGEYLDLYGVNRHQEWEKEGSALSDEQHRHDISEIIDMGANGLRLAHYQQSETIYSLCDDSGLVVWAEVPITPPYQSENEKYKANCRQQLTELIRQNYNHPAIFFWGMYNEITIDTQDVQTLHDLAKSEDPYRLTTAASNRRLEKRHSVTDLICWNRYPYWYGGEDISKWHKRLTRRKKNMKVGVSEYGAGGCVDQHQQNPENPNAIDGRFYPEEYQAIAHEQIWMDIKDKPGIWGKFIWNMFDFSWPTVKRGNRVKMNHKGLITYDRKIKKDSFFLYKANWRDIPVLHLTSKRHLERNEAVTDIKVYSNAVNVRFYQNGKLLGEVATDEIKRAVLKNVTLNSGENEIRVEADFSGKTETDEIIWTLK